jgi:exodeoxyribonuclease III
MLKLACWNVNGIRAACKKGFLEWLDDERPDILGIQESKISADQLDPAFTAPPGYTSYWSHADKRGYSGVALFTRDKPKTVDYGLGHPQFDCEGRTIVADYGDFVLYTVYYPNGQRDEQRLHYKLAFYDAFLSHSNALKAQGKRVIVCGDFNTAHHAIDLARPKENVKVSGFLPIERAWMDRFVADGYVDTFRLLTPDEGGHYTWWNMRSAARARNVGWRIDYFFVDESLANLVTGAGILSTVLGSDHCPITLSLDI